MTMVISPGLGGKSWTRAEFQKIAEPGAEGEVRFQDHPWGTLDLDEDGNWKRAPSGWYVEVCRGGEWRRELGPFQSLLSDGAGPPKEIWDAAVNAGLLVE